LSAANGGVLTDLGTLSGTESRASGVNSGGQVVGNFTLGNGSLKAFVFSNNVMSDLNTLIAPGSGYTLQDAQGISNTGFITGYAKNASGQTRAFLLTPTIPAVPEASSVVSLSLLLLLGLGGVIVAARRQKSSKVN